MTPSKSPQSKTLHIAVGSKNPVKITAVKEAFEKVFPNQIIDVQGVEVHSGVSDQPMSDKESIRGATKRAKDSLKKLNADFGVGLEGGLQKVNKYWFTSGWAIILSKEKEIGIGSSIRMIVTPKMMELINKGYELGKVNDMLFQQENTKHATGQFGLMTNNAITRASCYRDGVISALSRFIHPEVF